MTTAETQPHVVIFSRSGLVPQMLDGIDADVRGDWFAIAERIAAKPVAHVIVSELHLTLRDLAAMKSISARTTVTLWVVPAVLSSRYGAAVLQCGAAVIYDASSLTGPHGPLPTPRPRAMQELTIVNAAPLLVEPPEELPTPALERRTPRRSAADNYDDELAALPVLTDAEVRALLGANE